MDRLSEHGPALSARTPDYVVYGAGGALLAVNIALVFAGAAFLSRYTLAACQSGGIVAGALYGLYLATRSRRIHVTLERAYSTHLEELSQRLRTMAYRDAVTGLYNHRYFREQLSHEIERSTRYGQPLSLILMDMNGFKQINDRYGHFTGDRFLGIVGEVIARHVRSSDVGARYGGDEFVVLLPSTALSEAQAIADKLAFAVASSPAITTTGETVDLGISCGVAACPDDARTPGDLIEQADQRLYEVKAQRKSGTHAAA